MTVLAMRDEEGKSEDESGMYHVYGCINNRDENTEAGRVLSCIMMDTGKGWRISKSEKKESER